MEKKCTNELKAVRDLTLAIAHVMQEVSPQNEFEHQTILATGVVTYITEWMDFLGAGKDIKCAVLKAFGEAVIHASKIVGSMEKEDAAEDKNAN